VVGCCFAVVAAGGLAVSAGRPCDVESTYFCAVVETDPDRPDGRVLLLDGLKNSYVDLSDPTYLDFTYTQILGDVIEVIAPGTTPLDTAHVGGGGFTMPHYLEATRPGSTSIVFELDPSVVELAEDELALVQSETLVAVTGDARVNLRRLEKGSMDLVIGDAFGGEAVPWHLTTEEFVEQIRDTLRPGGVYALNVIDHGPLDFVRAEVATLRQVFEHVAVIAPADRIAGRTIGGNFILVASDEPIPTDRIQEVNTMRGDDDTVLADPAGLDDFVGGARVLTDEFAPVDQLLTVPV
jgi:SAM-dependent methyltransferase